MHDNKRQLIKTTCTVWNCARTARLQMSTERWNWELQQNSEVQPVSAWVRSFGHVTIHFGDDYEVTQQKNDDDVNAMRSHLFVMNVCLQWPRTQSKWSLSSFSLLFYQSCSGNQFVLYTFSLLSIACAFNVATAPSHCSQLMRHLEHNRQTYMLNVAKHFAKFAAV